MSENENKPRKSRRDPNVELMRIIACFIVVGTHIKLTDLPSQLDGAIDLSRIIVGSFFGEGVTVFFIITGFFLLNNNNLKKLWKKTTTSLLIPAFIYIMFAQLFSEWISNSMTFIESFKNPSFDITRFMGLLQFNIGSILHSSHLWYIVSYVTVILAFPLLKLLSKEENDKVRHYVELLSLIAVSFNTLQQPFTSGVLVIKSFTLVTSPLFLTLLGFDIYKYRDKIYGKWQYTLIGIGLYLFAHALQIIFQYRLYILNPELGHTMSWDALFALMGALGIIIFCFSLNLEKHEKISAVVNFIASYTFLLYIVHFAIVIKLQPLQQMFIAKFDTTNIGDLVYTLIYATVIFVISFVLSFVIKSILSGITFLIKKLSNSKKEEISN